MMKWFHGNLAWNDQENGNGIREQMAMAMEMDFELFTR